MIAGESSVSEMIRQLRLDEFTLKQQNKAVSHEDLPIFLNKEERSFVRESLSYAEERFNELSAKYHSGKYAVPNYYQDQYLPKKAMFSKMRSMF